MIIIGYFLFAVGLGWATRLFYLQLSRRIGAYEDRYLASTDEQLDALLVFMSPEDLLRISRVAGMAAFLLVSVLTIRAGLLVMVVLSGLAGIAAFGIPRLLLKILLHFRRRRFLEQFPDTIGMLNNAIKAGLSFMQALEMVAHEVPEPAATELQIFCRDRMTGKTLDAALDRLVQRVPLVDVKIFVMVVKLANRMGGNITEALSRLAETIRNRFMLEKKVRALTSEARMQAIVVCALPFFMFVAFAFLAPEMMLPLTQSWMGVFILSIVVILELVGGYFMWKAAQIKY